MCDTFFLYFLFFYMNQIGKKIEKIGKKMNLEWEKKKERKKFENSNTKNLLDF